MICKISFWKWGIPFDIAGKEEKIGLLEKKSAQPGFWDDPAAAQGLMQELTEVRMWLRVTGMWSGNWRRCLSCPAGHGGGDEGTVAEAAALSRDLRGQVEKMQILALFPGSMMVTMPSSPFMPGLEAPRPRTGWKCSCDVYPLGRG